MSGQSQQQQQQPQQKARTSQKFTLRKEEELRFETGNEPVTLKLLEGTAEVFGTELALNREYVLSKCNSAVFSWHGCRIELIGDVANAYTAEETPMLAYINMHDLLERERDFAAASSSNPDHHGPRVMVVGPTDSGKSSLCKIILGYAARRGRKTTFVDIDVGQPGISIPGTVACVPVEEPISIEEGLSLSSPLLLFFGHASPGDNPALYRKCVDRMAECCQSLAQQDPLVRTSGFVVNTCGWVERLGYKLIEHAARAFDINYILVIGDDRLISSLNKSFADRINDPNHRMIIVKIPKSGGVVARDTNIRRKARNSKIRQYFYGCKQNLSPHSLVINLNEVTVLRIGGGAQAPKSALPIGEDSAMDPLRITELKTQEEFVQNVTHGVLAVSYAQSPQEVFKANIAGIVYVSSLNFADGKRQMTVLSPSPGRIPGKILLVGSVKWLDEG